MLPGIAAAQVRPSAEEVARYRGLHATTFSGDLAEPDKLIKEKTDLNACDPYGSTPLHVATYARKAEAVRMLMRAGANPALLERDR